MGGPPGVPEDASPAELEACARIWQHCVADGLDERLEAAALRPGERPGRTVLRFARARQLRADRAFAMLRADVAWRETERVAERCREGASAAAGCGARLAAECFPYWHAGFDRAGNALVYILGERFDANRLMKATDVEGVQRFHTWRAERVLDAVHRRAHEGLTTTHKLNVVIDVGRMTLKHVTRDFVSLIKAFAHTDSSHFPERLGEMHICGVSSVFMIVWRGISPFVDEGTRMKIQFHTSAKAGPALEKLIDAERLASRFGGELDEELYDSLEYGPSQPLPTLSEPEGALSRRLGVLPPLSPSPMRDARHVALSVELPHASPTHLLPAHRRTRSATSEDFGSCFDDLEADEYGDAEGKVLAELANSFGTAPTTPEPSDHGSDSGEAGALTPAQTRLRSWLNRANVVFLLFASVLIAVGANAQANFWWEGSADVFVWNAVGVIFLGMLVYMLAGTGLAGSYLRSTAVLKVYTISSGFLAVITAGLGIACFVCVSLLDSAIDDSWEQFDADRDKSTVKRLASDYQYSLGISCLVSAVILGVACGISWKLVRELGKARAEVDRRELSLMLGVSAWLCILLSLTDIAYGSYAMHQLYYSEVDAFPSFTLVALGVARLLASVYGLALVSSKFGTAVHKLLNVYWWVEMLVGVAAVVFAIYSFVSIKGVDSTVHDSWEDIHHHHPEKSVSEVVNEVRITLIVVGLFQCVQALMSLVNTHTAKALLRALARTLSRSPSAWYAHAKHADMIPVLRKAPLNRVEKAILAWSLFTLLLHVFLEGSFVALGMWVKGDTEREGWYLNGWTTYGRVDSRYLQADSFVYSKESIGALLIGPLCLGLAWATYMRRPYRHVLAVLVCIMELHAQAMYLATEAFEGGRHTASSADGLNFWLLFVTWNALRVIIPVPILVRSVRATTRAVAAEDDACERAEMDAAGLV